VNTRLFPPSKRSGLVFHGILLTLLILFSSWGFINLLRQPVGLNFVIFLLIGLIAFAPLPLLGYRAFALFRAQYILNRDSLELRWGLRDEEIPLMDIEWVRPIGDLAYPLRLPSPSIPGAILGLRRHRDLGIVEFIASERRNLLLVATSKRVYAISPADPAEFTQTFSRASELGSLSSAKPKSIYPSFVLARAWESGLVRYLWLAALFLNIGLIVWTSLLIPALARVSFGFGANRIAEAVPSSQLVILPLLSAFLALAGWAAGLYFYRWEDQRVLSVIIWASGALTSLLFLIAVLFIISNPA
jgi:PH (Pleckstrin Homology) domain-containing protein